jgi:Bacterial antitoxin of type II TA system, VapB
LCFAHIGNQDRALILPRHIVRFQAGYSRNFTQVIGGVIFEALLHQFGFNQVRTTVTIDDELYKKALEMADPTMDKSEIFREAMKAFVRAQAGKRLIALGGAAPSMESIPRDRGEH